MSRQYLSAAKAVDAVDSGKQSFKSYCGSSGKIGKVDFALAAETMKYSSVLDVIFKKAGVSSVTLDVGNGLLKVMCYELFFGKNKISGGGAVKRAVMSVKDKIAMALQELLIEKGFTEHKDLLSNEVKEASALPKYIRINEIKVPSIKEGLAEILKVCPLAVMDDTIPSLVVIPPGKSLGEHPFVKDGRLIIQDKASCFPSQCLYDVWSQNKVGDIIDACAAPGNKTSHIAALTNRHRKKELKCKIFAFDKNPVRADLLQKRMLAAGAKDIVDVSNEDFLSVDIGDKKYNSVTCVLLDPSCSGSGVARDLKRVIERKGDQKVTDTPNGVDARLEKLRAFQIAALKKAMSFPAVKYIVYSTCSIHEEENESVVTEVLLNNTENILNSEVGIGSSGRLLTDAPSPSSIWTLVEPERLKAWKRRGQEFPGLAKELQARLIRCHPSDGLNGFFVAVFEKKTVSPIESEGTASTGGLSVLSEIDLNTSINSKKRKASCENSADDIHNSEDHNDSSTKNSPRNFWTSFGNFQKKNKKKKFLH